MQASQHSVITSLTSKNSRLVHKLEGLKQKKQRLQARLKLLHASIGGDSVSKGKQGQADDSDNESQHSELVSTRPFVCKSICIPAWNTDGIQTVLCCRMTPLELLKAQSKQTTLG